MTDSTLRLKLKSGPGVVVNDAASIDIFRFSSGGEEGDDFLHPESVNTKLIMITVNDKKKRLRIK